MNESLSYTGEHWLVEFHDALELDNLERVTEALKSAAEAGGVQLLRLDTHHFGEKQGVTGVALLAESHISIHTWPEHGYAAIDLFFCGRHTRARDALDALRKTLRPSRESVQAIKRGYSLAP